jgi:hypothetical protein
MNITIHRLQGKRNQESGTWTSKSRFPVLGLPLTARKQT